MKIEERVHSLLEDNSFPSILLLDGSWGVGKTHFIHNVLKPYIDEAYSESFKSVYLSLYGVTNLDDFKDRLLSLFYTQNANSGWFADKCSKFTGSSVQVFDGTRGVAAALGNVASIVKSHYFSKLNNVILFLDDLERVSSDTVKSEILGECLYLAENKNIKVVVVANENKINIKNDIEKVFSDIVFFSRKPSELIHVLDEIYTGFNSLSETQKVCIKKILEKHNLDNLRIIRRAIDRFKSINKLFQRDKTLNYNLVDENNLNTSFIVCIAAYQYGYSLDEILESHNNSYIRSLQSRDDKDETEEGKRRDFLDNLVDDLRYTTTDALIQFIITYENTFNNIEQELGLPVPYNGIQELIDYKFRYYDNKWLQERLPDLCDYIFTPIDKVDLLHWMKACNVYSFLINNDYVDDDVKLFESRIKEILPKFTYLTLDYLENLRSDFHVYIPESDCKEIFWDFINATIESKKQDKINSFQDDFLLSWGRVDEIINNKYQNKPFLYYFEQSDFEKILVTWTNSDIHQFNMYMRRRCDFGSIYEIFSDELESLNAFLETLIKVKSKMPYGAKRGVITELEGTLKGIYQCLEERVKASS